MEGSDPTTEGGIPPVEQQVPEGAETPVDPAPAPDPTPPEPVADAAAPDTQPSTEPTPAGDATEAVESPIDSGAPEPAVVDQPPSTQEEDSLPATTGGEEPVDPAWTPPPTPAPGEAQLHSPPPTPVGGASEASPPAAAEAPQSGPGSPGWVDNPLQTGSTGYASGGGDLTADSPALAHHIDPIAGEGEGGGGQSGAPILGQPGDPHGGDTTPSASQP